MEETISLQDIFKTLKKRAALILSLTVIAVIIAAIVSFFVLTPIYQANNQVLVNQKKEDITQQMTSADIQSNLQLINTYNEIIKSPAILSIVIENLDLPLTTGQLASKITVSNANNSQVLNVSVQDENYNVAADMANQVVEVFKEEVPKLMNIDNVNILAAAQYSDNPTPIKPNKMLNIAIALVIGLMIGIGLAFLLEYLDTTVKTEQDIEEIIGLPVIGIISIINPEEMRKEQAGRASRSRGQKRIVDERKVRV
ncbi:Wzz/FepE/Etk N-terminal domain-containing protein [Solibacillus sp. FSL W8-0474]|uniref:YveK family protein n=1 Tax=Solibacillus sp. FSL W8-0474 TaxID=2975336 RepID=UPI0030FAD5C6